MVNYQLGKIYKLVCNKTCLIYVGSTCEPTLARRLVNHKADYNQYLKQKRSYVTSFEIIKNGDYDIVLLESFPCNSKDELHSRERYYIESLECVNQIIPTRTDKEYNAEIGKERFKKYREANKDEIKQYKKQYYEANKDKINQRRRELRALKKQQQNIN